MPEQTFTNEIVFSSSTDCVSGSRIIYTPSAFARSSLIHLQETGVLRAAYPHKNERCGLISCLFFTVLSGEGRLCFDGAEHDLKQGDCVFIDCSRPYSHETGADNGAQQKLWSLQWCHFYGPNMKAIYGKYRERGGLPVFRTEQTEKYRAILDELYKIADSDDHVRDMRIHEKLSGLLVLLMEDAWRAPAGKEGETGAKVSAVDIQAVKDYIDEHFIDRINLSELADKFYLSKHYLMKLFKERYGCTLNAYRNSLRITWVKQQLRFTDKTLESLSAELCIEPPYLSRLFKKLEGVSPSAYRLSWRGRQRSEEMSDSTERKS